MTKQEITQGSIEFVSELIQGLADRKDGPEDLYVYAGLKWLQKIVPHIEEGETKILVQERIRKVLERIK